MSETIRLRSGQALSRTIVDYDNNRPDIKRRKLRAVCYAPFLSMDFDATGAIRLCNHSHTEIASMTEETSVLAVWRGEAYRRYRTEMQDYILDEDNCRHCVRQCEAGGHARHDALPAADVAPLPKVSFLAAVRNLVAQYRRKLRRQPSDHVFAVGQFDRWAYDDATPAYPKRLIFRLNNTCNLACVMCDGWTSSRIRTERDQLPLEPSRYGERFFQEMEEILPHVDHVEFYGGEPFLVKEHVRIFEIISKTRSKCSIFVNTNGVSLHNKAREFLEELNFKTIAVSMDAVHDVVHREVRNGLRSERFYKNMEYFLDLRARKDVQVMLNVTEHRKNWFELPEIFRFAQAKRLYLHINTCIHPHNVTLYTLPTAQLTYVLTFLEQQRSALLAEYARLQNLQRYDFLLSLIRSELHSRAADWQPQISNRNQACDGFLAAPIPGLRPFETPDKVAQEVHRIVRMIGGKTASYMLTHMLAEVRALSAQTLWKDVGEQLEHAITDLPGWQPGEVFQ